MNSACVDLAYLDPPFKSNRHYKAHRQQSRRGRLQGCLDPGCVDVCEHGELADRNPPATTVIGAWGIQKYRQ
ncbi:MAG: hypothetical protein OXF25_03720 [Cyanobacteria bacterium MAG CAR3_bin_5]|nr:hypothetical protein [Cyanobacteria bacterium MAG CAR3_bin_5]